MRGGLLLTCDGVPGVVKEGSVSYKAEFESDSRVDSIRLPH